MTSRGGERERLHGVLVRCNGQVSLPLKGEVARGWCWWKRTGEGVRQERKSLSPRSITNWFWTFSLLSFFICIPVPLPTWMQKHCCCRPEELLLPVTGHFGWMCLRNASAWPNMSTKPSSRRLMPISLNEKWSLCSVLCACRTKV